MMPDPLGRLGALQAVIWEEVSAKTVAEWTAPSPEAVRLSRAVSDALVAQLMVNPVFARRMTMLAEQRVATWRPL
jgi:hypothetical protein